MFHFKIYKVLLNYKIEIHNKYIITNVIDVASIKTLWNKDEVNEITKNYGMIIIDECHHLSAFTYEQAINNVNSKYVYGFIATPNREDGHKSDC